MSLFSHKSNATADNRLLGYNVRTSIFGRPIPINIGTNRIAPNVIDYFDWRANPVKSGGKSGGKGSGGKGGGGQFTYSASILLAACVGPLPSGNPYRVWIDKSIGASDVWTVGIGSIGQAAWDYLISNYPNRALGYSEIAWLAAANFDLGSGGTMSNFSFELGGLGQFGSGVEDALAADAIALVCTHQYLAAMPAGLMGDFTEIANYCKANQIFISPLIDSQVTAADVLSELQMVANCELFESENQIKARSYGDTAASSGFGTFTPNLTPIYDLYYDDFIVSKPGDDPVIWSRTPAEDADNDISIEWSNRDRDYNLETLPESNADYIRRYGSNTASPISAHSIKLASVAAQVASVELKKRCYKLRTCKFTLGWPYMLLEQMDLVTVPEQYPSTDRVVVRLLNGEEGDNGTMTWEAEVLLSGVHAPTLHPKQGTGGYVPSVDNIPGNCNPPVFLEETKQMYQGVAYALLIALSGGPDFGGGSIWTSWDGSHYEYAGRAEGNGITGVLSSPLPFGSDPDSTNTLAVDLRLSRGSLLSVSQEQVDAFASLCVVDGELLAYRDATLTGANQYSLGYLRRGVHSTTAAPHAAGAPFAVLDGSQFELPYQISDVGRTLWIKITAFNLAGQNEENLADVFAYQYRLKGPRLPYALKPVIGDNHNSGRGQLKFPMARAAKAIQVGDGLYGERSTGKATLAAHRTEVVVRKSVS